MPLLKSKIICECGQKSVEEAVEIFKVSTLPYKKAKKLVTECNQTCCRRPADAPGPRQPGELPQYMGAQARLTGA